MHDCSCCGARSGWFTSPARGTCPAAIWLLKRRSSTVCGGKSGRRRDSKSRSCGCAVGDGRGVDGARGADSVSGGPGEVGDAGACGGSLFVTLWLVTEKGGGRRRASRAASRRQGSVRAAPAQRGRRAVGKG